MLYRVTHITTYLYSDDSSMCQSEVHLAPRNTLYQALRDHELAVSPAPDYSTSRKDYFGNEVSTFSINEPHQTLTITAWSLVDVLPPDIPEEMFSPPWETVRDEMRDPLTPDAFDACQFTFRSGMIQPGEELKAYAAISFPPGRPLLEGAHDFSQRIYHDFDYDKEATTISTPVDEVFACRGGVCQDFAHLMIAGMRSLGLPARYVSGYLKSSGNHIGAEASHAWASVYCPAFGWQDYDPTNNTRPRGEHVTVAWGREYSDVTPVKGVAIGGGEQVINVAVEVSPVPG